MKISLILLILSAAATIHGVENQPYTLLEKRDPLEIRYYPPAHIAQIPLSGQSYRGLLNQGFRVLASYIFGNNDRSEKIAMTAPVIYTPTPDKKIDDTPAHKGTMAFVMPQGTDIKSLPRPKQSEIILSRTRPITTAHLPFGGFLKFAGQKTFQKKEKELLDLLKSHNLTPKGPIQHLYYTDPFNLSPRYAVAVEIVPPPIIPLPTASP